jgi:hypothetical protein
MMNCKKKILGSLMLFVVAAPVIFFTAYLVKQKLIQHKMAERLEASALITISISQADLKWEKEGSEAIVHGELFDVKSYIFKDGQVLLTGLYDYAEKKLKNDFAKIWHQKKDGQAPFEKLLLKFISTAAIIKSIDLENSFHYCVKLKYHTYQQVCVANSLVVFTPPPNV